MSIKISNCFHHRPTDVCKHTGKGKTFYSNEFSLCKNTWISCTASASTDPWLRLCGTQTHLFSVATKVYDAECFFCSYPRKKCHGNYTPASLQADTNGLVQQARSKRFNKTSKASAISTTESAASRGAKSHSNQTLKSYICANSQQKSHLSRIKCQMTKYDKGLYNLYNINKCAASMRRAWSRHQHPPFPTCRPAQPSWQIHDWAINSLRRKEWN